MSSLKKVFVICEAHGVTSGGMYQNPKVNKAMDACSDFVEDDFLDLALACLDQAGLSLPVQNKIEKMANDDMPDSVGVQAARDQEKHPNDQAL